jgi:IPT/TIG domain
MYRRQLQSRFCTLSAACVTALVFVFLNAACMSPPPATADGELTDDDSAAKKKKASDDGDDDADKEGTAASLKLDSISPTNVTAGSASPSGVHVTLGGRGFADGVNVVIGGRTLSPAEVTATSMAVDVPKSDLTVGNLRVSVVKADGTASNALFLSVVAPSTSLTSVNPFAATAGRTTSLKLVIEGNGFDADAVVLFDGMRVGTEVQSASSLLATVPSNLFKNPRDVVIEVEQGGVRSAGSLAFTVDRSSGIGICFGGFCF